MEKRTNDTEIRKKGHNTTGRKDILKKIRIILLSICTVEIIIFGIVFFNSRTIITENAKLKDINSTLTSDVENYNYDIEAVNETILTIELEIESLSNNNSNLESERATLENELDYYNAQIELLGGDTYE